MPRKLISAMLLALLILNVLILGFNVQQVKASGPIYIHSDGSIEPVASPISTSDNITYLFTGNITGSIYVQRNNILVHGNGYTVQGPGSGIGIDLYNVAGVTVEDTRVVGFQGGICLLNSISPNSVLENSLIGNQYGIIMNVSHNNIISGNNFVNSANYGIYLSYSTNNTISENTIETSYVGIGIEGSSNNTFYHNNIIYSSHSQVVIVSGVSANSWDHGYPFCGNYWSNYNGTDSKSGPFQNETGADGVGDTFYVIDSNNKDGYPLMNPWTANFTVLTQMVVGCSSGPLTLDPACAYDEASCNIITNVYETLIAFDEEQTDQFVPKLATDWYISPDGLTYNFRIRQGVKFHNGENLTVADVEYSLERVLVIDYYGGPSWMLYEALLNQTASRDWQGNFTVTGLQIDNAVTSNDTCVTLHLLRPYPPLMQILASPWSSILCKKWCVQIGDWPGTWNNWTLYNLQYYPIAKTAIDLQNTSPPGPHTNALCGTGPYMFDYYESGVEWQLVKFDGYWGGWPSSDSGGFLKRVTGKIVSDWETRKNMFLDGELDTLQVPQNGFGEVYGQPGVQCIYPLQYLECDVLFFTFDISSSSPFMGVPGGLPRGTLNESGIPPDFFTDINVRKGFAYAFNYTEFIAEALNGEAYQPATPIIPGLPYYNPAQQKYSCNLTKAVQYFSAAWSGQLWSHGFNFTICYNTGSALRQEACQIMKAEVESLNPKFHVQIQPLSWHDYLTAVENSWVPIFEIGWLADFPDPDDFAEPFMYSQGTFPIWQSYSNSTIDALVEQAMVEMNDTARKLDYYALQSLYYDNCPSVATYQLFGYRFQRNCVQGWHSNVLIDEACSTDYFYDEWKGNVYTPTRYSWDMFRHDAAHTGQGSGPAPETNRVQWNFTAGSNVDSSPAVVSGRVYVGSDDCNVYCLDAHNGTLLWSVATGGSVYSSPAVADGKVYVGSDDYRLYCFDSVTGASVWNFSFGGSVSSPTVEGGSVYFGTGSDDFSIRCCNASTGASEWAFPTDSTVASSPAVVGDEVYCASEDGNIYCLDALTGSLMWNRTIGVHIDSSPAVVNGRVYIGSDDNKVYCLGANTGSILWNYTTGGIVASSPAVADGKVYVGSHEQKIYCLDAVSGAHIWDCKIGNLLSEGYGFTSSPAVADGKVYVGSEENGLYCLDATTGSQLWNYSAGGWMDSSPTVADGLVFIGSGDSHVYAFGNVIRVPEDYSTVQAAINAAAPGATVWIAPGVYNESLVINKKITLIGEPGSEPRFDCGGSGIAITILSGGSGSTIAGIAITSWDGGISLQDANNCRIYDNIMSLITNNGITLQGTGATNNQIYSNIFKNDAVALDVASSSSNNVISQNIISLSGVGLKIETGGNIVCENIISDNQLGLALVNSNNNVIYHNDFLGNTNSFTLSSSTSPGNTWDNGYPSGGNFWSTYSGADLLSGPYQNETHSNGLGDGIYDTPYAIAVNNKDRYPLTKPFFEHSIGIASFIVAKTVVCRGYGCDMTVSVLNYGMYDETFNVTAWANQAKISLETFALTSRSSSRTTFTWNTAGIAYGNYTVASVADMVPGETSQADHTVPGGWVMVSLPGDITSPNGWPDGLVDMTDIGFVASHFLGEPSKPLWNPNADINNDYIIDMADIGIAASHFLDHYP